MVVSMASCTVHLHIAKQILSDNALRFKSASNVIKNVWCEVISDYDVLNYVEDKGVEWKFIVELAPLPESV
jgi:hypothetical protein